MEPEIHFQDEQFADVQLLRYRLKGFDSLSLRQKEFIYYLSEATLYGRDITFDQFGLYNLRIRKTLEAVYTNRSVSHDTADFRAMEVYLKRLWFSNGIYHHYGSEKFQPAFSEEYLRQAIRLTAAERPKEIARIMGSDEHDDAAMEHAKRLLTSAGN